MTLSSTLRRPVGTALLALLLAAASPALAQAPTAPGPEAAQPRAPANIEGAGSVEQMTRELAELQKAAGLLPNPAKAVEYYHNARIQEDRGQPEEARKMYLAFARYDIDVIDPYLRLATLIRVQEGKAAVREVYAALKQRQRAPVLDFVMAVNTDGERGRQLLGKFLRENPDYAPVHYMLAEQYSEDVLGKQTIDDKRQEFEQYGLFLKADREGRLTRYYLDHGMLGQWLEKARRRYAILEKELALPNRPVAAFVRSNAGWMMSLSFPEAVLEVAVRFGEGEFRTTGFLSAIDPRTGKTLPNPSVEIPPNQIGKRIEVRYRDGRDQWVGPFPIIFNPTSELVRENKDILDRFRNAWIAFSGDGKLVYFTHLMSYRCAIESVAYGFENEPLERKFALPPCDEANPYAIPSSARPYVTAPRPVKGVRVQITWRDGTKTEVVDFDRATAAR